MATVGGTRKIKAWKTVCNSLTKYIPKVVEEGVRRMTAPGNVPEELTDNLTKSLQGIVNRASAFIVLLQETDRLYTAAHRDLSAVKKKRDEVRKALYELLSYLRQVVRLTFGEDALVRWGLSQAVPEEIEALLAYTRDVKDALASAEPFPEANLPGGPKSAEDTLTEVEKRYTALDDVMTNLGKREKDVEAVMFERHRVHADHNELYPLLGRIAEDHFRLAKLTEEANRVRPSTKTPGQLASDDDLDDDRSDDEIIDDPPAGEEPPASDEEPPQEPDAAGTDTP